jgi:hypothetical protein
MKEKTHNINKKLLVIIHCIIPIFLGGILYILFRSSELKMFKWFAFIGFDDEILSMRMNTLKFKNYIPDWLLYSLPDGIWVYSFTSVLLIFWDNDYKNLKIWILIPFITGIIIEILQGLKLFRGTFDVLDLSFSIIAFVLSVVTINYKFKQYDKQVF